MANGEMACTDLCGGVDTTQRKLQISIAFYAHFISIAIGLGRASSSVNEPLRTVQLTDPEVV